jgi:ABC-type transporter Mla subunit MlaD
MRFSEQGRRDLEQWQSNGSNGVLNDDRVRKALARSFGTSTGTTTAEGSRFTEDVRDTAGQSERQGSIQELVREHQRNRPDPKRTLEQISTACEQLERSATGLQDTKRNLDQAIASARNASTQAKEMNEPQLRSSEFPYEIIENYFLHTN